MTKEKRIFRPFMLMLLLAPFFTQGQSLPTTQKNSVHAPRNIKIDGNSDEWNNKFEAYNKSTQIYYTISNDLTNLYLTVQANDINTIKKIVSSGLTLTINKLNKKKDSTAIAFTFPVYDQGLKSITVTKRLISGNKAEDKLRIDSLIKVYNRQIPITMKVISVRGLKTINNESISVYNEEKIKAAALFDKNMYYNYELAIPLKLIEFTPDGISKFYYNVQINGLESFNGMKIQTIGGREDKLGVVDKDGKTFILNDNSSIQDKDLYYPTNFWAEYTLSK